MSALLRKINRGRWFTSPPTADAFNDVRTQQDRLSVWRVTESAWTIELVVTALATSCDHLSHIDVAVFEETTLIELGIAAESTIGESACADANHLHVDLVNLTAQQLYALVRAISSKGRVERYPKSKVKDLVTAAFSAGQLRTDKMKLKTESINLQR